MPANLKHTVVCSFAGAGLAFTASFAFASERVSSQTIVNALTPKPPLTRSLSVSPADQARENATKTFVDTLRNRPSRSLSLNERQQIATIAHERPRIDLEIKFEFNSAQISRSALADVEALGKALTDPALKGSSFVLSGHTDAVGSEEFNQQLSERRADAVKQYLVANYRLAPEDLVTAGYGETQLKDRQHPDAAANRQVEVVNVAGR